MDSVGSNSKFAKACEAEVTHFVSDVGVEAGYGDADSDASAVEEFWGRLAGAFLDLHGWIGWSGFGFNRLVSER